MSRRKLAVVLLALVLAVAFFANTALLAKQKVVFWSFAANNIVEWEARKARSRRNLASPL